MGRASLNDRIALQLKKLENHVDPLNFKMDNECDTGLIKASDQWALKLAIRELASAPPPCPPYT